MDIQEVLKSEKYTLIDVREPMELMMDGSLEGALNIPTGQIEQRLNEINKIEGPKILFCRSGGRSSSAANFLLQQNIKNVYIYQQIQEKH